MTKHKPIDNFTVLHNDIGDRIICDFCDLEFTDSDQEGGFLFQSKAVCPNCTPRVMSNIAKYNEQSFIKKTCPTGMSFKKFVLEHCR